ncbi:restriction endonuclease subunit S [Marinobacter mobilis]|uniref:restriction endonuclease subunit S n=1 Tax=Marinobacter mobilis TaxID=488533 RepID=UPI0035C74F6F
MSSKWRKFRLEEQCERVTKGTTPTTVGGRFTESGINFIKVESIGNDGQIQTDKLAAIDAETDQLLKRSRILSGDILFTIAGTIGRVCLFPEKLVPANTNQAVAIIRLKNNSEIDRTYLYYALRSEVTKNTVAAGVVQAVQANFSLGSIKKLEIHAPSSIDEQREVAKNLKALDDKIQLNNQINQTLEQMAQAIFKSWFVDFEPVKAKIAALEAGGSEEDALLAAMQAISGKGEAELTRLQAEQPEQYAELRATADLFPSAMQDSELGEIPEGWEVVPLSAMVNLIGGGTPKKSEPAFWNGHICWFSVKDVPSDGNVFVVDTEDKITEEGLNRSSTKLLPIGTTIITARGTVGKLALTGVSTAMNQSCYGVVASDETGPYLNYLRLSEGVDTLKRNTHGAVFDTITRSTFDTVLQPRSCLALRQRFEQTVTPMFEAIRNNLIQSNTLSEARDSLLPKLLSGELSVSEAEIQLAEAEEAANV